MSKEVKEVTVPLKLQTVVIHKFGFRNVFKGTPRAYFMDHDIHALGFMVVLHVGLLNGGSHVNVDIHRQVDIS